MRKLLKATIICAILLIATTAQAKNLSAWLLGDTDSLTARVGYRTTTNTETGLESCWFNFDDAPQVWGMYGLFHWPDAIKIANPIPFEGLPKELTANIYLGAHAGLNLNSKGSFVGPVVGAIIQDVLVVEYQWTNFDWTLGETISAAEEHKVVMGLVFRF